MRCELYHCSSALLAASLDMCLALAVLTHRAETLTLTKNTALRRMERAMLGLSLRDKSSKYRGKKEWSHAMDLGQNE